MIRSKIGALSFAIFVVAMAVGFVGVNVALGYNRPLVAIPPDAKIGAEYPAENEADIARATYELFLDGLKARSGPGAHVPRDAHPRSQGCVRGRLSVGDEISAPFKHGLFAAPKSYPVWIRFSSANPVPQPDNVGDARGMAIKVMGVEGPKLLDGEKATQDFLLISTPRLPQGDPGEYLDFFRANNADHPMSYFLGTPFHWKLGALRAVVAFKVMKIPDLLETRFWSTTPFKLGETAVKYGTRPCAPGTTEMPKDPGPRYLREAMIKHLAERPACFDLMIQPQIDAVEMPVEDPGVGWDEERSPFVPVARVEIPPQRFDSAEQDAFCDGLSFDPWHSLPDHRPLGGINRVRKYVYERISRFRHDANAVPRREPDGSEKF
jgi:hypothetical protein